MPEQPQKPRRRTLRRLGVAFACVLVLLVAGLATVAWQATHGGVSLDPLRRQVEAAILARLPAGATVAIGAATVSYRWTTGIAVHARDVELALPDAFDIEAGELSTAATASAILRGTLDLNTVAASDVDLTVILPRGPETSGTTGDLLRSIATLAAEQVGAAADLMGSAGLEQLEVRGASLRLVDRSGQMLRSFSVAEATWLPLEAGRSKAWLRFGSTGGAGWDMTFERERMDDAADVVTFEIEELPAAALVPRLSGGNGGPYLRAAITLQVRMASLDGKLLGLRGRLSTGAGEVSFTGKDRIDIAGTSLAFALGETGSRMTIPAGEISTREGRILFSGSADLDDVGGLKLAGRVLGGALPTFEDRPPIRLLGGGVTARVDFSDLALEVQRLALVTAEGSASAIGQASLAGPAPGLSFALSLSEMPAEVIRSLWPPFIAAKSRGWFDMNVKSGTLGPATLRVALPPDYIGARRQGRPFPSYALIGTLPFKGAQFSPLPSFPVIEGADGDMIFADGKAKFVTRSGTIDVPGYENMQSAGTSLLIPELGRARPWGDLHLELAGPAAALAVLSDTPPLDVARTHGIVASALSGDAVLSLDASIPLFGGAEEDIHPTFRLALDEFSSTSPIEGRTIDKADLMLEGSPESFTVKGEGMLDGMDATVDLILGTAASGQMDVVVELDDEARERLGLSLGGLVVGPVQASLKNGDDGYQLVALDLKDARIALASLGWEKGSGVPATAHFRMREVEDGTEIADLLVTGKGFGAKGSLKIGKDGRIAEASLTEVSMREGDRLALTAVANGSGYDVRVEGGAFDARGLLAAIRSDDEEGENLDIFPIRIDVDIGALLGEMDVVLDAVSGSLALSADGVETAMLSGKLGTSDAFEWTLEKDGKERYLRLLADDAGELFRFAGLYSKIAGGNLILDYSGKVEGAGSGVAMLRNFRVINDNSLAPVLASVRSRENPMAFAPVSASANDMTFSELRVPFTQEDWIVTILDATLRGPMMGATGEGTVNVVGGKVALSGTFIPAFGINNIAGAIPIIGPIIGGGRDEGLVGITYKMFGPLEAPTLTVNPMSAIAPGIFRKIFE